MKIGIGGNEGGYGLKQTLKPFVGKGYEVEDFGADDTKLSLYPDIEHALATAVAAGRYESAHLICGAGIGMADTANRVKGVRAVQRSDTYSAKRAVNNHAHIVARGPRVIGSEWAKAVEHALLSSRFGGDASAAKAERIIAYDNGAT